MAESRAKPRPTEAKPAAWPPKKLQNNYLRVTYGKLSHPSGDAANDGKELVRQCLGGRRDEWSRKRFPPQLFVLWLTRAFADQYGGEYRRILNAVRNELRKRGLQDVPFIGSSVAVCLFDDIPHEQGALLICLASRFLEARLALGGDAQIDPKQGVSEVLQGLGIEETPDPNPLRNRFLLTFLPGYGSSGDPSGYTAPAIIAELNKKTCGRLHMFGGVSSGGLERSQGSQFLNDEVHTGAVVVAMVTSYLTYGVGLSEGLVGTGQFLHVKKVADDGRTILEFHEGPPAEVMEKLPQPWILSVEPIPGERVIIVPRLFDGCVKVQRLISEETTLQVMKADEDRMRRALDDIKNFVMSSYGIKYERFVGLLGIGCVSRYRARDIIGLDLKTAFANLHKRFPGLAYAGCYMDGEIGIDRLDRTVFGNWSITELPLVDELSPDAHLCLAFEAKAKYEQLAMTARSVHEAIDYSLQCVEAAGYLGGMISLVLEDGDKSWIVAHAARGGLWAKEVLPLTRREFGGKDVLAVVADERRARYIRDATSDDACDQRAAWGGRVISFYAFPLLDEHGETIGILQIDLGDLRDVQELSEQQKMALNAIGAMAAGAVNRAIQTEELKLSRHFDTVLTNCLVCDTEQEASQQFIEEVAQHLGAEGHIRLRVPGTSSMDLVAGVGEYFKAASQHRRQIDVESDFGPSARAVRESRQVVVNDLRSELSALEKLDPVAFCDLRKALRKTEACAYFTISNATDDVMGVVCISSKEPWFFSQSLLRSLEDVGQRLAFVLTHVRQKQAERRHEETLRTAVRAQRALSGMARYLVYAFHAFANLVQETQSTLRTFTRSYKGPEEILLRECRDNVAELGRRLELGRARGESLANLNRAPCQLFDLLDEVIALQRVQAQGVDLDLISNSPGAQELVLQIDIEQMRKCFSYLIENAIKAVKGRPSGGRVVVTLAYQPLADHCSVQIADNGSGLLRRDFDMFVRGDQSAKATGSGMGLFLSGLFCASHGGGLELETTGNAGTTIKVTLPLRDVEDSQ